MKKLLAVILVCLSLGIFTGCGAERELAEESAQCLTETFASGDMESINHMIFGTGLAESDKPALQEWEAPVDTGEGVLAQVFPYVTVDVEKTTRSVIKYKIEAPDMSRIFEDFEGDRQNISEDDLLQYIKDYSKNTARRTTTVSLAYTVEEGNLIIDYQDEEFINAVTGGLLEAYRSLYSEMLEAYMKGASQT